MSLLVWSAEGRAWSIFAVMLPVPGPISNTVSVPFNCACDEKISDCKRKNEDELFVSVVTG